MKKIYLLTIILFLSIISVFSQKVIDIDVFEDVESETYGKYWNGCQIGRAHV